MKSQLFAKKLQTALNYRGWRQAHLAKVSGISKSNVSKYLKGFYSMPQESTIDKIAEALDVPKQFFIDPNFNNLNKENDVEDKVVMLRQQLEDKDRIIQMQDEMIKTLKAQNG